MIMRSERGRTGADRLNPFWNSQVKTYERCGRCRSRFPVTETAARAGGAPRAAAIAGAVLLFLAVLAETVVLALMAFLVSWWLAVGAVGIVALTLFLLVRRARRRPAVGP